MSDTGSGGALEGIRVVEMGQLIAGPFCGQLLGDMGAEIVKLEPPVTGDQMRNWGQGDKPSWWRVIARNKYSVAVDLRSEEGQALARELIAKADILIENFRPGTLEKWNLASGTKRRRTGSTLPAIAPSNVYPCKDGEYLIGANQDGVFARLAAAMGRPELASDDRYATHRARGARQEELDALIGEWTRMLTIEELETRMIEAGVPAGRIFDAEDMMADPHFAAREALVTVADEELGEVTMQGVFPKLSATPGSVRRPAPLTVGQDSADVLRRWLGREG